ncbi:MAG: IS4 family transposase [Thermodesulfobacteriota bacterium]
MADHDFIQRHRIGTQSFTRKRLLPFQTVMLFLMNLIKGSLQDELDHFFKAAQQGTAWVRIVTKSAFCRARKKLSYLAFTELNQTLIRSFYLEFPVKTWFGFNLMAFDGSTAQVPATPDNLAHFGDFSTTADKSCPLARVSQMFDVLNKITVDASISPLSVGERDLAVNHLFYLRPTDLVLMDRGYPAFWLFKLILTLGGQFCARISPRLWSEVKNFHRSGAKDKVIKLSPTYPAKLKCRELGLDENPLELRLLRIERLEQPGEVLITSLVEATAYPSDVFDNLYRKRWPIEQDYNLMKNRLEIEKWSDQSPASVYQDFHAKVLTKNLAAAMVQPVQETINLEMTGRKYKYQINFTQVLSKFKDTIVSLFQTDLLTELIEALILIFSKTIEPIRPGRKCLRLKKMLPSNFNPCYKPLR